MLRHNYICVKKKKKKKYELRYGARIVNVVWIIVIVNRQILDSITFRHHPPVAVIAANPRVLNCVFCICVSVYFSAHGARVFLAVKNSC
jgi:hypothetical protein